MARSFKRTAPLLLLFGLILVSLWSSPTAVALPTIEEPGWEGLDERPVPTWYRRAKFGIFIHWGVYSVPSYCFKNSCEWYWLKIGGPRRVVEHRHAEQQLSDWHDATYGRSFRYSYFARRFRAELFNSSQWAGVFRASGAKYVVLTSKHHDGWCNYPEPTAPNWNSVDVGPHRDLVGELSDAVRAAGLEMGLYHSLFEWFHPLYLADKRNRFTTHRFVDEVLHPAMRNVVRRYRPSVLWTDGDWDAGAAYWKSTRFLTWLFEESPVRHKVVIGDRWGNDSRRHNCMFWTVENKPGVLEHHPWEECHTIGNSWGFNRRLTLEDYETTAELLELLMQTVAYNGNLLLNVGPTADGRIPVLFEDRLRAIGKWLQVNGEAVFDTVPW
eukprot:RCo040251